MANYPQDFMHLGNSQFRPLNVWRTEVKMNRNPSWTEFVAALYGQLFSLIKQIELKVLFMAFCHSQVDFIYSVCRTQHSQP